MTGYRSTFFRHECRVRGCYVEQLPSWDHYIRAFPRNIRPTDVDGLVEVNGHILVLEEKCVGKGPDEGQRRALQRLASLPNVRVVFFRPIGTEGGLETLTFPDPDGWKPTTSEAFALSLHAWAVWADNTPPVLWTAAEAVVPA